MAKTTTVGRLLLNNVLPSSHQITDETNKKQLNQLMTDLAHKDPRQYVQVIGELKRVGDAVATDEGITVGLDDIEPDYARRDAILEPALKEVRSTQDPKRRLGLIHNTQKKLLDITRRHPGQMTPMAVSGARGKLPQLMRTVTSPVAVVDDKGDTLPWIISKSYAEGLKPADSWVAMSEARRNAVASYISVAEPGEVSKLLVNNMSDQLVTMPDCGTTNGIAMSTTDRDILDRYLAKGVSGHSAGSLVSPRVATALRRKAQSIIVRSPMTCEAPDGVCQKCYGLNTTGKAHTIGTNVGMLAAHAAGEPLTQMALSAKHATRIGGGDKAVLQGMAGFRQLTEIPQSFFNKATLASRPGTVTKVSRAPQGGHYVHVDEAEHYVPPNLDVRVSKGSRVDAGDILSDGIPKPDEIVQHKGLGAGRKYLVDQLHGIYSRQGIGLDRRHLELLAKTDLNYVKMMDRDSDQHGLVRGDIVDYNQFRNIVSKDTKRVPLAQARGATLGQDALHYTVGTQVTPGMLSDLRKQGLTHVSIAPNAPLHEPVMKPMSRTPLLHPDWLARLGHRNLKNVLLEGAAFGESANIHGTHPVPAFVFGEEFGEGPKGRY